MKTVETIRQFSKLLLTHDLSRGLAKLSCDSFNRFNGLFAFWSRLNNQKDLYVIPNPDKPEKPKIQISKLVPIILSG
ncbi:MAG: hypothetical protein ABIG69_18545 [Bacteroidota bacterium]